MPTKTATINAELQAESELSHAAPCRVGQALRRTPELSGSGISWYVEEGALVLRGRVRSFYQKQVAQTVAGRLDSFSRVINELEVDDPRQPLASDPQTSSSPLKNTRTVTRVSEGPISR